MNTHLDCLPCILQQALRSARLVSKDPGVHEFVLRAIFQALSETRLNEPPPLMGPVLQEILSTATGLHDPFMELKQRSNQRALELYPELEYRIARSDDPFDTAVRAAVAGNRIDYVTLDNVRVSDTVRAMEQSWHSVLNGSTHELGDAIARANRILYLADNAGEILLDRLLIERMPLDKITLVVRGHPIYNDATIVDAKEAGLDQLVEVIDNGSRIPGTFLDDCSASLRQRFFDADLVIAKGMGNFETLCDVDHERVFFLLVAKCDVVARAFDCRRGDFVVHTLPAALQRRPGASVKQ